MQYGGKRCTDAAGLYGRAAFFYAERADRIVIRTAIIYHTLKLPHRSWFKGGELWGNFSTYGQPIGYCPLFICIC